MERNEERYTLLIVDDEPVIADGLRMLFEEQQQLAMSVSAAYSAIDALEIFERMQPDIVLLDIKMPGVTGMELANQLKKQRSDTVIIFLTGYDHFEYAYKAIKQEAFDYILKTEGDDKVITTVGNAVNRLRHERKLQAEYDTAQKRLANLSPMFRHNLLLAILTDHLSDSQDLQQAMAEVDLRLNPNQDVVMILGCSPSNHLSITDKGVVQLTLEQILQAHLTPPSITVTSVSYMQDIVWFILFTGDSLDHAVLAPLLEDTQPVLKDRLGCSVSFAISNRSVRWSEVSSKYHMLRRVMSNHGLYEQEGIAVEGIVQLDVMSDEEVTGLSGVYSNLQSKMDVLETYLYTGHYEKFKQVMAGVCNFLASIRQHRSLYALEVYFAVGSVLMRYMNQNRLAANMAQDIDLSLLFYPDNMKGWIDRANFLRTASEKLCDAANVKRQINAETTLARIKDYIQNNLSCDLSLTALGKASGFNPAYLSRLFKREIGVGLHEYITDCRMALAKSLLVGTRMKIYEIGQRCGYENSNYFIKTFKLVVGLTPQDFRNRNV